MANIRIDLNHTPLAGEAIKFKAPCDAKDITGLTVYYVTDANEITSKEFTLTDANGGDIGAVDNIFSTGAIVKVILDTDANNAFVQNPDTNTYLERRFEGIEYRVETLENSGGSGANVLTVTLDWDAEEASHLPSEITAHVQNGGVVQVEDDGNIYPLVMSNDGDAVFYVYKDGVDGIEFLCIDYVGTIQFFVLASKNYVDNNAGGGSGTMIVTVTGDLRGGTATANKSATEICNHVMNGGNAVCLIYSGSQTLTYTLDGCYTDSAYGYAIAKFKYPAPEDAQVLYIEVHADASVTFNELYYYTG